MTPSLEKKVTEGITFRVEKEILDRLRHEAKQRSISVNTLANQMFNRFLEWDISAGDAQLISFPKALLVRILEKHSEEEVIDLAEYIAKNEVKDIVLLLQEEYSPSTLLEVIEDWLIDASFPYKHEVLDNLHSYTIQHDMSEKWSLYLAKLYQVLFEEMKVKHYEYDTTRNTLKFKVEI